MFTAELHPQCSSANPLLCPFLSLILPLLTPGYMVWLFPRPPAARWDHVMGEIKGLCVTHTQDTDLKTMSTPSPRSPLPPSEPASMKQKTRGAWPSPMDLNHLEILVKYRFWFTKPVAGPENTFCPSSRWRQYCWSAEPPTGEVLLSDASEMAVQWWAVKDTPK